MRRGRLFWQIFPALLLILLTSMVLLGWYATQATEQFHLDQTEESLDSRATLIIPKVYDQFTDDDPTRHVSELDALCKSMGTAAKLRITLVLTDGTVLGDTEGSPKHMDNHAERPEIRSALAGTPGTSIRFSHTVQQRLMYHAAPIRENGSVIGVVRTSVPLTRIEAAIRSVQIRVGIGASVMIFVAGLVTWWFVRRNIRPIEELRVGVEQIGSGDLSHRVPVPDGDEVGSLALTINSMASQLESRIASLDRQKNEQAALLTSMVESVIAVDANERILSMNRSASRFFGIDPEKAAGSLLSEVARQPAMVEFVRRTLKENERIQEEIVLHEHGQERRLQASGTVLRDAASKEIGALLLLNDVTQLRKLESIRRDFVANVSHELKTPITAIKGFVETMRDGTVTDPEDTARFLKIVSVQSDRLNAIIEDLLSLSRIEQGVEQEAIQAEATPIKQILQDVVQSCGVQSTERDSQIQFECSEGLTADVNPALIEQALVNLVSNALKYSPEASVIRIVASESGSSVSISVIDNGPGIAEEHLDRLFERFYRVDKARSREIGGTGLGLAIVKHIARAHGGRASVKSSPGEGSTFTITFPRSV